MNLRPFQLFNACKDIILIVNTNVFNKKSKQLNGATSILKFSVLTTHVNKSRNLMKKIILQ